MQACDPNMSPASRRTIKPILVIMSTLALLSQSFLIPIPTGVRSSQVRDYMPHKASEAALRPSIQLDPAFLTPDTNAPGLQTLSRARTSRMYMVS